ncbi:MAG: type II CRISPR-associated endonuclease Cas1 [Bacteroidota bacterium]
MIKRTLYFSNPVYLSKKNDQLYFDFPDQKEIDKRSENLNHAPIEDLGIVVLDNQQITITHGLLAALINNNTAVITCDSSHMPNGLFLPLAGNTEQNEKFRDQINSSEPLKKQLWQQTVATKITNQSFILKKNNVPINNMLTWAKKVRSGDPDNYEGRAAAYYWKNIFKQLPDFIRDRFGEPPNNLLNYGYAILRAVTARSLVGSGLLPTLGIHHANKYNAYCLADDIMEPYRPFVDLLIKNIIHNGEDFYELTPSIKKQLLEIPVLDVYINDERSPLMIAMQKTTASLSKCFSKQSRKILYPILN